MIDTIVIGKGPAGISAALYLKRAGKDVKVIASGYGALEKTDKIQNYYGTEPIVSGKELLERGIKQAKELDIDILDEEVVGIVWLDQFVVKTTKGDYETKSIIIATGAARNMPKIKGLYNLVGYGVSFCAICDAFFYRGKTIAVLGEGNYAKHELEALGGAKKAYILSNGKELTAEFNDNEVVTEKIVEIVGDSQVEAVMFESGKRLPVDGVFIALGQASCANLAKTLGLAVDGINIKVDKNMATNIPGIYCAGDCTGGLLQISKAVGEGAIAATGVINYIKNNYKKSKND